MTDFHQPAWLTRSPSSTPSQPRISRSIEVAIFASLLLHAVLLFVLASRNWFNQPEGIQVAPSPFTVQLAPAPHAEPPQPPASPQPKAPERKIVKPRPQPPHRQLIAKTPPVPAAKPAPETEKVPPPQPLPSPVPQPAKPASNQETLDPTQFADMASYIKAMREKRQLPGEGNDEIATKEATKNTKHTGGNGVFQILGMDAHSARFTFRGWKDEFSYVHRETYEVEPGADGDITRAVVRKMIEIIRRDNSGDFNWESYRLGRVVVLSARPQDNAGLEDFLVQEFFGPGGLSSR